MPPNLDICIYPVLFLVTSGTPNNLWLLLKVDLTTLKILSSFSMYTRNLTLRLFLYVQIEI